MPDSNHEITAKNWHFTYWYPSNNHGGEDASEYDVKISQIGDQILFESLPKSDGSYAFIRLTIEGDAAIGTWYEKTSPTAEFEGMTYSGAGQLMISPDGQSMEGQWAGAGIDRKTNKKQIYTGRWRLEALQDRRGGDGGMAIDFSGVWLSRFGSAQPGTNGGLAGEHYVTIGQRAKHLMIGGVPQVNSSSIVLRLSLEGLVATGTWQEYASGVSRTRTIHHGGVQFVINPVKRQLLGSWVGFGEETSVDVGQWEILYVGERLPDILKGSRVRRHSDMQ